MAKSMSFELLVATYNPAKINEISTLLVGLPITLRTLDEFPNMRAVSEDGSTYGENAAHKARSYARATGLWSIADDSGLEVNALGGAPGVLSARYPNEQASDEERINALLAELSALESSDRGARFCCCVAIADPGGEIVRMQTSLCEGTITSSPRGKAGFGYDPIFVPAGFNETFAQLSAETKNKISHRGKALRAARDFLREVLTKLDRP